jgi:acyl-CoA thioester hydrolase
MQKLVFEEKIYTYHIDFVGHVNNIIYIQWLENGRNNMLEAMGAPAQKIADIWGIMPVLTETHIVYRNALYLKNTVTVEMWLSKLNNASAIMEFRIFNEDGVLCAEAWQKGLFVDAKTKKPARLVGEIRKAFEVFLIEDK